MLTYLQYIVDHLQYQTSNHRNALEHRLETCQAPESSHFAPMQCLSECPESNISPTEQHQLVPPAEGQQYPMKLDYI